MAINQAYAITVFNPPLGYPEATLGIGTFTEDDGFKGRRVMDEAMAQGDRFQWDAGRRRGFIDVSRKNDSSDYIEFLVIVDLVDS